MWGLSWMDWAAAALEPRDEVDLSAPEVEGERVERHRENHEDAPREEEARRARVNPRVATATSLTAMPYTSRRAAAREERQKRDADDESAPTSVPMTQDTSSRTNAVSSESSADDSTRERRYEASALGERAAQ